MANTLDPEKWQRYIDNQCSAEEKKEMLFWLQSLAPGDLEKMLDQTWEDANLENTLLENKIPPMPRELDLRVYSHLIQQLGEPVATPFSEGKSLPLRKDRRNGAIRPRHAIRWYMKAAACLLLVLGSGIGLLKWIHKTSHTQSLAVTTREIRNRSSAVEKAFLPDGSRVWLTPQSSISVSSDFDQKERRLELHGEGYFEIHSDPAHPFIVIAGGLQTFVLGTHFNIESYPGEAATKVSLSEGRVAIQWHNYDGKDSMISISSGTRITYQPAQQRVETDRFPLEEEAAWRRGSFVVNDLPLSEALQRLATRFGKTILFHPADFRSRRFTATYEHPDCKSILENMAYVQQFHYRIINDSTIIINP